MGYTLDALAHLSSDEALLVATDINKRAELADLRQKKGQAWEGMIKRAKELGIVDPTMGNLADSEVSKLLADTEFWNHKMKFYDIQKELAEKW